MAQVFVYAPDADDFDCLGMCGPLTPTKCIHVEDANGMSEIALDHPIDENNRWSFLQVGYILKAEVPVRTCPEVTEAGAVVTALEKWNVRMNATKGQRYLYSKANGGKKKKLLSPGTEVVVTKKDANRYKAKTRKHSGWIASEALENKVDLIAPENPEAIEQVVPAWSVRPQLFRIHEAVVSDDGVRVKAQHIFYDLLGNNTTYSADNPTCVAALAGILDGCAVGHAFEGYTNMLDTRIIDPWTRVSPVEALLNPETGLIARWGGELVRDDEEFYVLNRAGMNRGVRIAYGKNLLGVDCTVNQTDVITRIKPVGQTKKGKPLLLAAGTYTVDGKSVTIDSSLTVAAPNAGDYPTPHVFVLDVGKEAKAAGTSAAQVLAARVKMIRAALRKFADEECNLPSVNLKVDFIALGDTAEYAQFRQLEDVFLFDSVRIFHPKISIDVTAQVNRVEFDCLLERFNGIELGAMRRDMAHTPIAAWQVPSALPGYKVAAEGLDASRLADKSVTDDQLAEAAVTGSKIAELAVGTAKIDDAAITTAKIGDAQITNAKIALLAVGTANIQDAAIETAKIADAAIERAKIAAAAIGSAQIDDLAVTSAKIALLAVGTANIQDAAIETAKIADAAIERAKIAAAAIGSAQIDDLAVTSAKIALGAITAALIENGAIGTAQIADASITDGKIVNLSANRINAGTLSVERLVIVGSNQSIVFAINNANGTAQLSQTTIDGGSLTQRTITADRIVAEAITAAEIASNAITANKILANAVTTDKINALAITTAKLAAGAITAEKIAAGTITADKIDVDNLFASSAFLQKLQVSAAPRVATLPAAPAVGQSVIYTGVTPNEYLQWTGKGINPTQRRYSASKSGPSVAFEDLSDDRALRVTVKNAITQTTTPTLGNQQPLAGKSTARVARTGKNILRPGESVAINGVTMAVASDGTVTLNGTCTAAAGSPSMFSVQMAGFYLDGQFTLSMNNAAAYGSDLQLRLLEDAGSAVLAVNTNIGAASANATGSFALANQYIWGYAIRVGGGVTYNNVILKPQLEPGADATPYEPYNGAEYTLSLPAPLYGVTGATDDVNNIGQVAYRTKYMKFNGTESWVFTAGLQPTDTRFARFHLNLADIKLGALGISSAFPWSAPGAGATAECVGAHGSVQRIDVYVAKTRMADWSDAWTDAQKATRLKTFFTSVNFEIVYELAIPVTATIAPVPMNGVDGTNVVASDGASIAVEYTGSGWAAVGAVQRIAIENVEITPELGIKVSQILTDGTNTKNVYTQLYSQGLKIYDSDTGALIGGLYMQNGAVYLFSSALADPRVLSDMSVQLITEDIAGTLDGFGMHIMKGNKDVGSLVSTYNPSNPSEQNQLILSGGNNSGAVKVSLYKVPGKSGQNDSYLHLYPWGMTLIVKNASNGQQARFWLDAGTGTTAPAAILEGHLLPESDNTFDVGSASLVQRWRKIYANSGTIGTSDAREKHDIQPVDPAMMRKFLMALDIDWFRLNALPKERMVGVIAQQMKEAMAVAGMPDDYGGYLDELSDHSHLMTRPDQLLGPIISVVQQQQRQIEELTRRLDELAGRPEAIA